MNVKISIAITMASITLILSGLTCSDASAQTGFTVQQFGPVLNIFGDNGDDAVRLTGDPRTNDLELIIEQTTGAGEWRATFSGVEVVFIDAGNGDNIVVVGRDCILDSVYITTGSGIDGIYLQEADISGDVEIEAGNGNNRFYFQRSYIGGDLDCKGGRDDDYFNYPLRWNTRDTEVSGNVQIDLGNGDDRADLRYWRCQQNVRIDMGTGEDWAQVHNSSAILAQPYTLGFSYIGGSLVFNHDGFGGLDAVVKDTEIDGSLYFLTRGGRDTLYLQSRSYYSYTSPMDIGGALFAATGKGNDRIIAKGLYLSGILYATMSSGQDRIELDDSSIAMIDADFGGDSDSVLLSNSTFGWGGSISGGGAKDLGNAYNVTGFLNADGFEVGNLAK